MAADLDQAYLRWSREGISDPAHPLASSIAEMLNHGSISFGRFASESLSWEKRSVFTHDRRQEELEKFKAPGLVAKKKAYFEEYYKRMRLLKSSTNEDQQMEMTSDHGADSCISSQTGEDNETSLQTRDPKADDSLTCLGNSFLEMTIEHKQNCYSSPLLEQLGSQPSVSCNLSGELHDENDLEKDFSDVSQVTCLNINGDSGNSFETLDINSTDKISSGAFETTNVDVDLTMFNNNLPEKIIKEMDVKFSDAARLKHDSGCKVTKKELPEGRSIPGFEAHGVKPDKLKVVTKNDMEPVSNLKRKNPGPSTRTLIRPRNKNKSEQITSSLTNYSPHKTAVNRGSIVRSTKESTAPRNNRTSFFSTDQPMKLLPTVTVSRPFSFTTGKHYTAAKCRGNEIQGSRDGQQNSKSKIKFAPSFQAKDGLSSQNTSKNCSAIVSMKSVSLEKNRHREGVYAKPLCTDNRFSKLKRDGLADRLKSWSVNLPAADRSHLNSKPYSGGGIIDKEDPKVGKTTDRQSACQGISVPSTSCTARKLKTEVQQIIPQKSSKIVVNGKKPRQAVKIWR